VSVHPRCQHGASLASVYNGTSSNAHMELETQIKTISSLAPEEDNFC